MERQYLPSTHPAQDELKGIIIHDRQTRSALTIVNVTTAFIKAALSAHAGQCLEIRAKGRRQAPCRQKQKPDGRHKKMLASACTGGQASWLKHRLNEYMQC